MQSRLNHSVDTKKEICNLVSKKPLVKRSPNTKKKKSHVKIKQTKTQYRK